MTVEDDSERLRAEHAALRQLVAQLQDQLAMALQRIAELEQRPPDPPAFVKPNRPPRAEPSGPRKQRAPDQNRARHREEPTQIVLHALDHCPHCAYLLRGTSLDYRRQVIDLPLPPPVEIIEHRILKRWCPRCQRWRSPTLPMAGQVLGQGRISVRVVSLIAYLRTTLRLPIRRICAYLQTLHNLTLSPGAIVALLHQLRRTTQPAVQQLQAIARGSPVVHADETGWREAGRNGFIWTLSTPGLTAVRYYEYDPSRAGAVLNRLLGGTLHGHLVSDFYGGYNIYAGQHQRCWVHVLRDLHTLKIEHPADGSLQAWAAAVRALYDEAQLCVQRDVGTQQAQREQHYQELVEQAHALGLQSAQCQKHPCAALAKRLLRHQDELFQFVLVAGLRADNNLAERSLRPVVVIRKISGGSQSAEGTKTRLALASLFETWQARSLNPFEEGLKVLRQTPLPQL